MNNDYNKSDIIFACLIYDDSRVIELAYKLKVIEFQ